MRRMVLTAVRIAVIGLGTAVLGQTAYVTPSAFAAGSCGAGSQLNNVAIGTDASSDWWTVEGGGWIELRVIGLGATLDVWNEDCSYNYTQCDQQMACHVYNFGFGVLHVQVRGGTGPYALYESNEIGPDVTPSSEPCNVINTVGVCVAISGGDKVFGADGYSVVPGTGTSYPIAGRIDLYSFSLPTGGEVTVPCVVLQVSTVGNDACTTAGGRRESTIATLVDDELEQPSASLDTAPLSVEICDGAYTVTVSGVGIRDIPALVLCGTWQG